MKNRYNEDLDFLSEMLEELDVRWDIKKKTLEQHGAFPESELMQSFSVYFSIAKEELTIFYDGEKYNRTSEIPDRMWKIGNGDKTKQMNDPTINWIIRAGFNILVKGFLLDIDEMADIDLVPPF